MTRSLPLTLVIALLALLSPARSESATLPPEITRLVATFNDGEIPFNETPLVVGSLSAKTTALLFYAPSSVQAGGLHRRTETVLQSSAEAASAR